jgi:hypothetical protein
MIADDLGDYDGLDHSPMLDLLIKGGTVVHGGESSGIMDAVPVLFRLTRPAGLSGTTFRGSARRGRGTGPPGRREA